MQGGGQVDKLNTNPFQSTTCGGISMPSPSWMVCCPCRIPLLLPVAYPLSKSVNRPVQSSSEDKVAKGFHKGKTKTEALEPIEKEKETL